ncbi:AfsR/SARP family transcriptional regulator [Streptomyces sp. NPDC001780]
MEIKVLGRLNVTLYGISVVPPDPESRRMLALLALCADQVVPTCLIAQELWPYGAPSDSDARLRAYAATIRRLLAGALEAEGERAGITEWDLMSSTPFSHRLSTCGGTLDALQFERDAWAGYRAMVAGDLSRAAVRLRHALALWRGDALAGLEQAGPLRIQTGRLQEARMAALEQWAVVELRLGRHREILPELRRLTTRYPTHQKLHRHYMNALLSSGRPAEALRVYERLSDDLRREGRREPSPELHRLRRRILAGASEPVPRTFAELPAGSLVTVS